MTLDEYQAAARRTVNPGLSERDRLLDAAAGLSEETGELLGLVRKQSFQSREVPREKLIEELGDVLWCVAITAESLGVTLEDVGATNIAKLKTRHPQGFSTNRTAADWSRTSRE